MKSVQSINDAELTMVSGSEVGRGGGDPQLPGKIMIPYNNLDSSFIASRKL